MLEAGKPPEDLAIEPDTVQDAQRRIKEVKKLPPA